MLQAFLDEFPKGTNAGAARVRVTAMQRQEAEATSAEERHRQETDAWAAVAANSEGTT